MDILILQWLVLITGILDAIKYKFISQKVSRYKSSKEQSRKMINLTLLKNFILLIYGHFYLNDWAISITCMVSLYTCSEAFYYCYTYYPYKNRKRKGFKKPSIITYTINSLTPNKYAKKL